MASADKPIAAKNLTAFIGAIHNSLQILEASTGGAAFMP